LNPVHPVCSQAIYKAIPAPIPWKILISKEPNIVSKVDGLPNVPHTKTVEQLWSTYILTGHFLRFTMLKCQCTIMKNKTWGEEV
jgi:hypothetical protein